VAPPRGGTPSRAGTPPVAPAAVATKNTRPRKDAAASFLSGRAGGGGGRGRGSGRGGAVGARAAVEVPAAAVLGAADSLKRCLLGLLGERPYKRQAVEQARRGGRPPRPRLTAGTLCRLAAATSSAA